MNCNCKDDCFLVKKLEQENAELKYGQKKLLENFEYEKAHFEKENAELKAIVRNTKAVDESFAKLQQENAELKAENQRWKDEWQEQVQKATDEGYARTLQTMQLTKAKVCLEQLVSEITVGELEVDPNILQQAEQFLNEMENEE